MNATHFIKAEKDGKLSVTKEAKELLSNIKNPVAVISIAGLARTGKSFILNKIVESLSKSKSSNGFKIGSTIDSCTKGIWIWGLPVESKINGEKATILLLDTEGLASLDESQTHDAKIFTLSILLSSLFVYNSMGTIDSTALDRLSLVCELTKHIQLQTHKQTTEEDISKISPSFIWLLRDFSLQLQHDGKDINSNEYLELALKLQKNTNKESKIQNVKKSIQNLFPSRDCFTLVRPVNDENKIRKIESLSKNDFRPEFTEQIQNFLSLMSNRLKTKEFNNQKINGMMLFELTKSYVNSINEGKIPNISGAWESMVEIQCQRSFNESKKLFENSMNKKITELNDLEALYEYSLNESLKIFDSSSIGELSKKVRLDFIEESKKLFLSKKKELEFESREICQKLIQEMNARLNKRFNSFDEFQIQFAKEKEIYGKNSKGPSKVILYQHFLENDLMVILKRMMDSKEELYQQKLKQLGSELDHKMKEMELQNKNLKIHENEMKSLQENKKELMNEINKLKNDKNESSFQSQRLENELKKAEQLLKSERDKTQTFQTKSDSLQSETKNLQLQFQKTFTDLENQKKFEVDQLKSQLNNFSIQITTLQQEKKSFEKKISIYESKNQHYQTLESLEPENKQLKERLKVKTTQVEEMENTNKKINQENEKMKQEFVKFKEEFERLRKENEEFKEENEKLKEENEKNAFQVPSKTPKKTKRTRDEMEEESIPSFSEEMETPTKKVRKSVGNISYESMSPMLLKSKLQERGVTTPKKNPTKKDLIKLLKDTDEE